MPEQIRLNGMQGELLAEGLSVPAFFLFGGGRRNQAFLLRTGSRRSCTGTKPTKKGGETRHEAEETIHGCDLRKDQGAPQGIQVSGWQKNVPGGLS